MLGGRGEIQQIQIFGGYYIDTTTTINKTINIYKIYKVLNDNNNTIDDSSKTPQQSKKNTNPDYVVMKSQLILILSQIFLLQTYKNTKHQKH